MSNNYDAIVIGSGFGGCSSAALLAKRGLKVLLVEKNPNAGGKAMTLTKNGFTYCPWVVVGAPVLENKHDMVLKVLEMEDRSGLVALGRAQGNCFINDAGEFKFLPDMEQFMDAEVMFDWLEIKPEEMEEAYRILTDISLMPPEEIEKLHNTSFDDFLGRYTVPAGLHAFLCSLLVDLLFVLPSDVCATSEAIVCMQDMFLRDGGLFHKGGYGALAEIYCDGVRENGGTVLMGTRTEKIIIEDGKVTGVETEQGSFYAPIVISNAGIQPTVLKLVGEEHFDDKYVSYVKDLRPSVALMGTRYFLNKPVAKEPYGVIFSTKSAWTSERYAKATRGETEKTGVIFYEVPSNYDPDAAPEGKQVLVTSYWCPADPNTPPEEFEKWREKSESLVMEAFPELEACIEDKDVFTSLDVSMETRDHVLTGQGGECIGLGQFVGQCGDSKPSAKAPVQGLFYVGCDAGGIGVGTQQAVDSGMKVADKVFTYHQTQSAP